MDKLTKQIKELNKIYRDMKKNFDILKKMFNKNSGIKQKILLTEALLGDVYMLIMDKIESKETNKQFFDIIKDIKDEKEHPKN